MNIENIGKWVTRVVDNGTVIRARLVFWREQDKTGKWSDTENLAVEIQRLREREPEFMKIDMSEAIQLASILDILFLASQPEAKK